MREGESLLIGGISVESDIDGTTGVPLLSRIPFDEVTRDLPGNEGDDQARFIEAVFSVGSGAIRIGSLYFPNGNPPASDKFDYKLAWMEHFERYVKSRLADEEPHPEEQNGRCQQSTRGSARRRAPGVRRTCGGDA